MADVAAMDIIIGANVQGAVTGFNTVQKELAQTAVTAAKVDSSFSKFSKGTNQATQSLTDLGRVVQDAPFGFIGIANNINPLVESFGRLKKETGSTAAALKGMLAGLAGPAGIGIAISVVTSLLVVFGDKLFGAGKEAEKAADAIKDFATISDEAAGGVQGQIAAIQSYASILTDSTRSLKDQKEAAEQLHKINKEAFGTIEAGKTSYEAITKAVNEYTKALIAQATVKGLETEIGQAAIATLKAARAVRVAQAAVDGLTEEQKAAARAFSATSNQQLALEKATNTYNEALKKENDLTEDLNKTISANINSLGLFGDTHKDTAKKITDTKDALKDTLPTWEEYLKLSRRIYDSARDLSIVFRENAEAQKIAGLNRTFTPVMDPIPFEKATEAQEAAANRLKFFNDNIEGIMKAAQALAGVFENVFSSIASGGQNMVKSLLESLQQLIIKLAAAALAAVLINVAFGGSFGAIFGGLTGLKGIIPGLAGGGIVTGPTAALIGEAGPEVVFPLDRLREFIQPNAASVVVLETQVRGNDLYLIQSRTQQRRNRTY